MWNNLRFLAGTLAEGMLADTILTIPCPQIQINFLLPDFRRLPMQRGRKTILSGGAPFNLEGPSRKF